MIDNYDKPQKQKDEEEEELKKRKKNQMSREELKEFQNTLITVLKKNKQTDKNNKVVDRD